MLCSCYFMTQCRTRQVYYQFYQATNKTKFSRTLNNKEIYSKQTSSLVCLIFNPRSKFIRFLFCPNKLLMIFFHFSHSGRMQIVDGHRIEFTISARGKLQLIIDDFPFCRKDKYQKKTYYACVQYKVLGFVFLYIIFRQTNDNVSDHFSISFHLKICNFEQMFSQSQIGACE